jgi:aldehyde:ferredoxin oxidoreductase
MPRNTVASRLRQCGIPEDVLEHALAGLDQDGIGRLSVCGENLGYALNSLGVCVFDQMQVLGLEAWADLYTAATGIQMDAAGLLAAGARGTDVEKAFNVREGASRKDDTVPDRFFKEPIKVRGEARPPVDHAFIDKLVTDYYTARGWDPREGTLRPERMAELGLEG